MSDGVGSADNVLWQVGSSATLNTKAQVLGNVLALTAISSSSGVVLLSFNVTQGLSGVTEAQFMSDASNTQAFLSAAPSAPTAPGPQPNSNAYVGGRVLSGGGGGGDILLSYLVRMTVTGGAGGAGGADAVYTATCGNLMGSVSSG
ncbi:hypothetical protein B484DRAFT_394358 [Ochromonadaceae sp. CCMP2298]|nr:hypothetical protein B484DRAFT_394358 [Ochromonadaceae sp. CCMP2298]